MTKKEFDDWVDYMLALLTCILLTMVIVTGLVFVFG